METLELIFGILSCIAFFLPIVMFGSRVMNEKTGRMEWVDTFFSKLGCIPRLIIVVVCILVILIYLQLSGNYVFWEP